VSQDIHGEAEEKHASNPMAPDIEGLVVTLEHGSECVTETTIVQSVTRENVFVINIIDVNIF
jgi:hypothetical protein